MEKFGTLDSSEKMMVNPGRYVAATGGETGRGYVRVSNVFLLYVTFWGGR